MQTKHRKDFADNYEVLVPENFNFAYDVVDAWALEEPNKKAMLWTDDEGGNYHFNISCIISVNNIFIS